MSPKIKNKVETIPALKDPFFEDKKTDKDDPLLWKLEMKKYC